MLELTFGGHFQCRLATGADDHDHPRGEHGWTFAFPGEPDLDRVIRSFVLTGTETDQHLVSRY